MVKRWSPKPKLWVQVPFFLKNFNYFFFKKECLIFFKFKYNFLESPNKRNNKKRTINS